MGTESKETLASELETEKKIPLFCPCSLSGTRARRSTAVLRVGGATLRTMRRRRVEVEEAVAIVDAASAGELHRPAGGAGEQREETTGFSCSGEGREERKLGRGKREMVSGRKQGKKKIHF